MTGPDVVTIDVLERKRSSLNHEVTSRFPSLLGLLTDCLFYNDVFIVCYLLTECFFKKEKKSPFSTFLRFPLYVVVFLFWLCCFLAEGFFFIRTVQVRMSACLQSHLFSIFVFFFFSFLFFFLLTAIM